MVEVRGGAADGVGIAGATVAARDEYVVPARSSRRTLRRGRPPLSRLLLLRAPVHSSVAIPCAARPHAPCAEGRKR